MAEIFGNLKIILYLCSRKQALFESYLNNPGKGSLTRTETISDTLADHLRHAEKRSHIISHACLHHRSHH